MDPLEFLFSLERLGMKFGLDNMRALCAALDHPERAFRSIHIAGTNGKGSVTAMTTTALQAAGYRVARYTSPHLAHLEERFVIDGGEIDTDTLREAAGVVQAAVAELLVDQTLGEPPTFFECATAIAFELFRGAGVDIAVIEVGLGGRLDATNVIEPMVAAITSIDFDHQAQLGNDLASIAFEKAGIIKPRVAVVCGPLPAEAAEVIAAVAAGRDARMIRALESVQVVSRLEDGRTIARFESPERTLDEVTLSLRGQHQISNAAVVVALADELQRVGVPLPDRALAAGLSRTVWEGRLEARRWHGADVLLDAAHNPAGAGALAAYLEETGWSDVTLVFGAMKDKDVAGILTPLAPRLARIVCTTAASPRAMPAGNLAVLASGLLPASVVPEAIADPADAMSAACQPGSRVVVAGSIFLVGPLRDILR